VPAVIGEIGAAREAEEAAIRPRGRSLLRPILLGLAGVALVLLLAAGLIFLGPVWQRMSQDGTLSSAQQLAVERWTQWEASFNAFIDGLIIRYYDNRPELPF
jgi:hypothetical protein